MKNHHENLRDAVEDSFVEMKVDVQTSFDSPVECHLRPHDGWHGGGDESTAASTSTSTPIPTLPSAMASLASFEVTAEAAAVSHSMTHFCSDLPNTHISCLILIHPESLHLQQHNSNNHHKNNHNHNNNNIEDFNRKDGDGHDSHYLTNDIQSFEKVISFAPQGIRSLPLSPTAVVKDIDADRYWWHFVSCQTPLRMFHQQRRRLKRRRQQQQQVVVEEQEEQIDHILDLDNTHAAPATTSSSSSSSSTENDDLYDEYYHYEQVDTIMIPVELDVSDFVVEKVDHHHDVRSPQHEQQEQSDQHALINLKFRFPDIPTLIMSSIQQRKEVQNPNERESNDRFDTTIKNDSDLSSLSTQPNDSGSDSEDSVDTKTTSTSSSSTTTTTTKTHQLPFPVHEQSQNVVTESVSTPDNAYTPVTTTTVAVPPIPSSTSSFAITGCQSNHHVMLDTTPLIALLIIMIVIFFDLYVNTIQRRYYDQKAKSPLHQLFLFVVEMVHTLIHFCHVMKRCCSSTKLSNAFVDKFHINVSMKSSSNSSSSSSSSSSISIREFVDRCMNTWRANITSYIALAWQKISSFVQCLRMCTSCYYYASFMNSLHPSILYTKVSIEITTLL